MRGCSATYAVDGDLVGMVAVFILLLAKANLEGLINQIEDRHRQKCKQCTTICNK